MHQGSVLARVRICVSGFHGVVGERKLKNEKNIGGGEQLGSCSRSASLKVFQVDIHHGLEHLSCFGIFDKSNVLQVGMKSLER